MPRVPKFRPDKRKGPDTARDVVGPKTLVFRRLDLQRALVEGRRPEQRTGLASGHFTGSRPKLDS